MFTDTYIHTHIYMYRWKTNADVINWPEAYLSFTSLSYPQPKSHKRANPEVYQAQEVPN